MTTKQNELIGAIEAGGTKFICLIGTGPNHIVAETRISTTDPNETLGKVKEFFRRSISSDPLKAIGIAAFGPVEPSLGSPYFGYITNTPKPGWSFQNIVGVLKDEFDVPYGFDTDVNGAAYGELVWGAGQGLDTIIYLTIGTGIGGGAIVGGNIVHGLMHPEMGHIRIPHNRQIDPFEGICPYHKDCFEGLACGPAIASRWDRPAQDLPDDHPAWDLEAEYIATALVNYTLVLSPQKIILGGGVMNKVFLFDLIREKFRELLRDYVQKPETTSHLHQYIVPPGLGVRSGALGALALGYKQLSSL